MWTLTFLIPGNKHAFSPLRITDTRAIMQFYHVDVEPRVVGTGVQQRKGSRSNALSALPRLVPPVVPCLGVEAR